MIQVLGLRDVKVGGVLKKRETFFNQNWRFENIKDVFSSTTRPSLIEKIRPDERFNLYFTVADCFEQSGRKLKEQWAVPFDIDKLALPDDAAAPLVAAEAAKVAIKALGLEYNKTAVVFSGNGVQFFVQMHTPIISDEYFQQTREHYALLCSKIQHALDEAGIQGEVDTSVWSKGRLMRLPDTLNKKPGKPTRQAVVLQEHIEAQDFDIAGSSGLEEIEVAEQVNEAVLKNYPKPDTKAVCEGCKFLVHCKEKPNEINEPAWYAMTSITARLDSGRDLTHDYSQGHSGYNHYETEHKIDQALAASGPRTCKDIATRWDGCQSCDNYGRVTSPIMIKGLGYIASKDFGFRIRRVDKEGNVKIGPPAYMDLLLAFGDEHAFKTVEDSEHTLIYNGRHWEVMSAPRIKSWVFNKVHPEPRMQEVNEFMGLLKVQNVTSSKDLMQAKGNRLNFSNVVLDLTTMEVTTHSQEYGFFNVLPFPYDPRATAPRWEQFLYEIMDGDHEKAELLKQFGGYAISGDNCWLQKALLLIGEGQNGKSIYMEILGEVVGKDSHSAVPMQEIEKDTMRYQLVNKLFNYSEETSMKALSDSSTFKTIVSGGVMTVKQLYSQPYLMENRAKIIMSANNMPYSTDKSHGMLRRLTIVHFNRKFIPGTEGHDFNIKDKLRAELPGICNSLIAAYRRVKAEKRLTAEKATTEALEQYKAESDTVLMFMSEQEFEEGHEELMPEVFEQYKMFADSAGFKPMNNIEFSRQLRRHYPLLEIKNTRRSGRQVRLIYGVKLQKGF